MTRTRPITLVLFAVLGGAAAWLLEVALAANGQPIVIPPISLALVLAVIGGLDILLALPIRRAVKSKVHGRVDPFYATRVLVFSKASAIAGSLLTGAGIGILVFVLSRSVIPGVGSIVMAAATAVGALVLLVGGLVAEYLCSIPPDDDDKQDEIIPATVRPH